MAVVIYKFKQTIALDPTTATLEDFDSVVEKVREIAFPHPNHAQGTIEVHYEIEVDESAPVPSTWESGYRIAVDGPMDGPVSPFLAGARLAAMAAELSDDLSSRGFHGDLLGNPTFDARVRTVMA